MKFPVILFLASVFSMLGALAADELKSAGVFDNWPVSKQGENSTSLKHFGINYSRRGCGFMEPVFREQVILECFDPNVLSSPDTQAAYEYTVDTAGKIHWQLVTKQQANDTDLFYCEQAFAESSPISSFPAGKETIKFTRSSANGASLKDPQERVYMHFVPMSVERAYHDQKFFTEEDIDCRQNLVSVSKSKIASRELKNFRDDWTNFIIANKHPRDRQVVVDFAKAQRLNYSQLFD